VREGQSTVLPQPLVVRLSNAEAGPVAVTVTASGAAVTVPGGGVQVPVGELSAAVPLAGVTSTDGGVLTLTAAAAAGVSRTAQVRVLGLAEPAHLVSVAPALALVPPGTTVAVTVRLDLPAPAAAEVTLALSPPDFGTLPATVTVPVDALSATVSLTLGPVPLGQRATLTATLGTEVATATVVSGSPVADHLVISEVAAAGPGGANDEFVELYNPTAQAIDLGGFTVQYLSAAFNSGIKVLLPTASVVEAHRHFLVSGPGYARTATVLADFQDVRELAFSGTAGHVQVLDASGAVVDRLGYGAAASQPEGHPFAGLATGAQSFERKANAASTAASMGAGGADELQGNGQDSDDNAADFVVRAVRDPQSSQSPAEP